MDTFSALADPNRRQIIELLAKNEQLSSTDISDNFKISAPAISQHLKVLREAKLVKMEKHAQQHLYQINPAKIGEIEEWVKKLEQMWNARMDRLEQVLADMQKASDSVRIVLFDLENPDKFLILSETDDPTNLKLPGGRFANQNESPDKAAERELLEELGLEIKLTKAGELVNDDGVSKRHIYFGTVITDLINPSLEVDHIEWISVESVPAGKNKQHILSAVKLSQKKHGRSR